MATMTNGIRDGLDVLQCIGRIPLPNGGPVVVIGRMEASTIRHRPAENRFYVETDGEGSILRRAPADVQALITAYLDGMHG